MVDQTTVVQVNEAARGPRGLQGAPGDQGPQGPAGPIGPTGAQGPAGDVAKATNRTALAAIAGPSAGLTRFLVESGREGTFVFSIDDLSAEVAADTLQGIYVPPSSDTTGASGAWVRKAHTITPFMFGAVGDGVTDDLAALTAFNAIVFGTTARSEYADWSGDFAISGKLTIGPAAVSGEVTEYNVGGRLNLTQLTATFESVRLRNLQSVQWKGSIGVNGIGSTSFASRTCGVGICLQQCARFKIGGLYANNFWFSGITYDPAYNSNGAEIGLIQATNIGSGHNYSGAGNGLTGNWSAAVNAGSSGSVNQTTTLTVDTLPDAAIETYTSFNDIQCHVRISGYLYFVSSVDRVNSKITIFPWIDPAAGASGTFEWVFGGAHEPVGANANVVRVGLLDAIRCGKGVAEASVYPSRYGSTILNQCGVHVMVGQSPTASSIGLSIDALYIEGGGSGEHIVFAHRFGNATNSHYIGSSYELDLAKCWAIGDARVTAGNIKGGVLGSYVNQTGVTIGSKGKLLRFHNNNLSSQSSSSIGLTGQFVPPVPVILQRDSQTVFLQVIGSGEYNRLFGYSGGIIGYIGSGTNGAPTGSFVFTPPSGGTINGGAVDATVTFSGFTGPVLFLYEHSDTAQLTWKVRPLGGSLKAASSSSTYAAPATTYVAPSGGTTVDTQARASLAQLVTDVAAIKNALAQVAADRADLKAKLAAAGLIA